MLTRQDTHIPLIENASRTDMILPFLPSSWFSDVNSFPALDSQIQFGPTYTYEYSTRQAYGTNITGWGPNDPLNATWWHRVTERESALLFLLCMD